MIILLVLLIFFLAFITLFTNYIVYYVLLIVSFPSLIIFHIINNKYPGRELQVHLSTIISFLCQTYIYLIYVVFLVRLSLDSIQQGISPLFWIPTFIAAILPIYEAKKRSYAIDDLTLNIALILSKVGIKLGIIKNLKNETLPDTDTFLWCTMLAGTFVIPYTMLTTIIGFLIFALYPETISILYPWLNL